MLNYLRYSPNLIPLLILNVGGICPGFIGLQVYWLVGGRLRRFPDHPVVGGSVGLLATFVSTLAYAASPLVSLYLLKKRLEKHQRKRLNSYP